MPKLSAGVLLYRSGGGIVEVLIAHPGGPFWARKDDGVWSIPKGEYAEGEDPWVLLASTIDISFAITQTGTISLGVDGELSDEVTQTLRLGLAPGST